MNYHNITNVDMLNGDGLRTVLWVAGCNHHCKGCQNPITWDVNGGIPFDGKALNELYNNLSAPYISGITFSGGDPLHVNNHREILAIAADVKRIFHKTVWLYTGYLWEDVNNIPGIEYVDVLVDGTYVAELNDVNYPWAGSINQRVIDVQKSLLHGCAIKYNSK